MSEVIGDRRRCPWGLIGAIGLIVAVEMSFARHEIDLTTGPRLEWRESRRASAAEATECLVLGLGTSMTKLGLYPSVVERESGLRTYNLAACAGRLPGSYYLLKRALAAGANPEAIVLEVHPSYLAIPFQESLVAWPDLLDPAESLDLAWTARDASFFAATALARFVPSIGCRAEIRASVLAAFRGEASSPRSLMLGHRRNLDQNAGAFVRRRDTPYAGEIHPFLEGMYLNPAWSADRICVKYLRRILDLCQSQKIQVYWLIPPVVPALLARRQAVGLEDGYDRFVRKIQQSYPDLTILDARRSCYDPQVFADAAHLEFSGAVVLSADIGKILGGRKAGSPDRSRWINLPAYQQRTSDARLEDIAQSIQEASASKVVR